MTHTEVWVFYVTVVAMRGTVMTNASLSQLQTQLFGYQICSHLCHKTAGCHNYTFVSSNMSCCIQGPNISRGGEKEKRIFNISKEMRTNTGNSDQTCPLNFLFIKTRNCQEPSHNRKRALKECTTDVNENWNMSAGVTEHCHKLYKSCTEGDEEEAFKHFCRLSSKKGGEIRYQNLNRKTLRHFIFRHGCNLSRVDSDNNTFLHGAVRYHFPNLVQCIVSKNIIPIATRGRKDRTAFMLAATTGNWELFDSIQQHLCDLSGVDSEGSNILHLACRGGNPNIVKSLLKRVDKSALKDRNNNGKTPIEMVGKKHKKAFAFLREILNS